MKSKIWYKNDKMIKLIMSEKFKNNHQIVDTKIK